MTKTYEDSDGNVQNTLPGEFNYPRWGFNITLTDTCLVIIIKLLKPIDCRMVELGLRAAINIFGITLLISPCQFFFLGMGICLSYFTQKKRQEFFKWIDAILKPIYGRQAWQVVFIHSNEIGWTRFLPVSSISRHKNFNIRSYELLIHLIQLTNWLWLKQNRRLARCALDTFFVSTGDVIKHSR